MKNTMYGRDYSIKMDLINGMGGMPVIATTPSIKSDEYLKKSRIY